MRFTLVGTVTKVVACLRPSPKSKKQPYLDIYIDEGRSISGTPGPKRVRFVKSFLAAIPTTKQGKIAELRGSTVLVRGFISTGSAQKLGFNLYGMQMLVVEMPAIGGEPEDAQLNLLQREVSDGLPF